MVARRGCIRRSAVAAGKRKHFELHSVEFFESKVLEKSSPGRGEVMLDRIRKGKEIAPRIFQAVA